jgi:6,7-dimethyl-8-ribityllumazine synthase
MAEHVRPWQKLSSTPEKKAHLLIIEARFYDDLADALAGRREGRA